MIKLGKFVGILATGTAALGLLQSPASAAVVAGPRIITGPGSGSALVKMFDPSTLASTSISAFPGSFAPGVRVAAGDLNGDGVPDIATAPGAGVGPNVKVFDGATGAVIRSFFAYDPTYAGGVNVALGDVNGDGRADIVTGTDGGSTPWVKVFDGVTNSAIRSFFPYAGDSKVGVRVAAADVNGDGKADLITGTGGGSSSWVKVFDGKTIGELSSFFAYDWRYTGGVFVAAGDVDGDQTPEILTSQGTGAGLVRAFTPGALMVRSFLPYGATFTGGVRVAAGNLVGDQRAEIVTGPASKSANVKMFDNTGKLLRSFLAYPTAPAAGVHVAVAPGRSVTRY